MSEKLWTFADEKTEKKSAYEYLKQYARQLSTDTEGMFMADVLQTIDEEGKVIYSFYLVVPGLRNFHYRLIEVVQPKFYTLYPVSMSLFGKADGNVVTKQNVTADNIDNELRDFITSSLTQHILLSLRNQLNIYKDYQDERA